MNLLPDSIKLLGLIVLNKPFEYSENIVSCTYENYVDLEDLSTLRKEIISLRDNESEDVLDDVKAEYEATIYFIDRIVEELRSK